MGIFGNELTLYSNCNMELPYGITVIGSLIKSGVTRKCQSRDHGRFFYRIEE